MRLESRVTKHVAMWVDRDMGDELRATERRAGELGQAGGGGSVVRT
jgi:hypothetical protein